MTTIAELMHPPVLVLAPQDTVAHAIEAIRTTPRDRLFTYPMVVDAKGKLVGLCVMRDLILAEPEDKIGDVMMAKFTALRASKSPNIRSATNGASSQASCALQSFTHWKSSVWLRCPAVWSASTPAKSSQPPSSPRSGRAFPG